MLLVCNVGGVLRSLLREVRHWPQSLNPGTTPESKVLNRGALKALTRVAQGDNTGPLARVALGDNSGPLARVALGTTQDPWLGWPWGTTQGPWTGLPWETILGSWPGRPPCTWTKETLLHTNTNVPGPRLRTHFLVDGCPSGTKS